MTSSTHNIDEQSAGDSLLKVL